MSPAVHSAEAAVADLATALKRLRGDRQLLCELIEFFENDGPALLTVARESLAAGDYVSLERAAHSLKGLAATFEALPAAAAAGVIEEAAREQRAKALPALVELLARQLEQLRGFLSTYRQNQDVA